MRSVWSRERDGSVTSTATPPTTPASRIAPLICALAVSEDHAMDKKAKTPKKPKQTKTKDGAAKGK